MANIRNPEHLRIWLPAIRVGSGADVFVLRLAEALKKAGHEPLVQWFDHRYELFPHLLRKVMAPVALDVVHASSWQGFAFKRPGVPLVVTEHQYVAHPEFGPFRSLPQTIYHRMFVERWMRMSYSVADAIVAVSHYCAEAMQKNIGRDITIIHNWIDTDVFSPGDKDWVDRRHDIPSPFTLLFVGNPSRWKGAELLPALAERLGPGFQINCLGGLRKGFSVSRMPENMRLLPKCSHEKMPEIYRAADAVLVPTRYEAFGYVALEAMACGIPVIGFNVAGTAEVCQQEETALLAPMDDLQGLVHFANKLAHDPVLKERLGQKGRRRAVERFSEAGAISKYLEVYRQVINGKSSHG